MWLVFGSLSIICYVLYDFFAKKTAGKIDVTLGASIINIFALLVTIVWFLVIKFSGKEILITRQGLVSSALGGAVIGLGTIFFIKMFAIGTNLSIGVPLVRIGIVLLAFLVGLLVLKENVSVTQIIGLILSLAGLYLIVAR